MRRPHSSCLIGHFGRFEGNGLGDAAFTGILVQTCSVSGSRRPGPIRALKEKSLAFAAQNFALVSCQMLQGGFCLPPPLPPLQEDSPLVADRTEVSQPFDVTVATVIETKNCSNKSNTDNNGKTSQTRVLIAHIKEEHRTSSSVDPSLCTATRYRSINRNRFAA